MAASWATATPRATARRSAYRHTIEDSVYVCDGLAGHGIGRALLAMLIRRCEDRPWRQMLAVIGDSDNAGSIGLHASQGFRQIGTLDAVGFKFGRWVDSVLMQRPCTRRQCEPAYSVKAARFTLARSGCRPGDRCP